MNPLPINIHTTWEPVAISRKPTQKEIKNRVIYSSYLSPNYLRTTDERICDYTNSWMEKAIAQSSLISKVGEVDRENVFNFLNSIIDDMEDKLRYYSR